VLLEHPGISAARAATLAGVCATTAAAVKRRLISRGLLAPEPEPDDLPPQLNYRPEPTPARIISIRGDGPASSICFRVGSPHEVILWPSVVDAITAATWLPCGPKCDSRPCPASSITPRKSPVP